MKNVRKYMFNLVVAMPHVQHLHSNSASASLSGPLRCDFILHFLSTCFRRAVNAPHGSGAPHS